MKVLAIVPYSKNSFQFAYRQIEALRKAGVQVQIYHLKNRLNPIGILKELLAFQIVKRKWRPDIIHAHYGSVTSFFGCFNTEPLVVTFRGSDVNFNPAISRIRMRIVQLLSQKSSQRADHVFCVSQEIAEKLTCDKSKISILPSGVDLNEFKAISQEQARQEISLPKDKKILIFNAGRNPVLKRVDLAKQVYERLCKEVDNLELIILDGMYPPHLIPKYLCAADLLIMTSESEGSPNIIKEAAACGLPVVCFDAGDVRQILRNSKVSRVVAERNLDQMVEFSREILSLNSAVRESYLPPEYQADHITSEILKVYSRIR